jgi:hypothetical protein
MLLVCASGCCVLSWVSGQSLCVSWQLLTRHHQLWDSEVLLIQHAPHYILWL